MINTVGQLNRFAHILATLQDEYPNKHCLQLLRSELISCLSELLPSLVLYAFETKRDAVRTSADSTPMEIEAYMANLAALFEKCRKMDMKGIMVKWNSLLMEAAQQSLLKRIEQIVMVEGQVNKGWTQPLELWMNEELFRVAGFLCIGEGELFGSTHGEIHIQQQLRDSMTRAIFLPRADAFLHPGTATPDAVQNFLKGTQCLSFLEMEELGERDVSLLLQLFPSNNEFVEQYEKILTERLLKDSEDVKSQREIFRKICLAAPELNLSCCDVMLHDVENSTKAIGRKALHGDEISLGVKQLSGNYWAKVNSFSVDLPEEIQMILELMESEISNAHIGRKLQWCLPYGTVELDLEADGAMSRTIVTTPLNVVVLFLVRKKAPVTRDDLERLGIPGDHVKKAVEFWIKESVFTEDAAKNLRVREGDPADKPHPRLHPQTPTRATSTLRPPTSGTQTPQSSPIPSQYHHPFGAQPPPQFDEMRRQFVLGMLENLGPMTAERIRDLLAQYGAVQNLSVADAEASLKSMVTQDLLDLNGNLFQVRK
ncbi:hypothetical protein HDU96_007770 [Phlyctochytrium bullatum]|nr:hypothetical protein HDU96_007770 [Phlyctochytrium bullatum]